MNNLSSGTHAHQTAGVEIERRRMLFMSVGAIASITLGLPRIAGGRCPEGDAETIGANQMSWCRFLESASPMAEQVTNYPMADEEAYLTRLATLVKHLASTPSGTLFDALTGVTAAYAYQELPLVVTQFKLQPGAVIPLHDHHHYNAVLNVTDGEVEVHSFDLADSHSATHGDGTFFVKEKGKEVLIPGDISTLSRHRDNIHELRAGHAGARFVDFFTYFTPEATSYYLNIRKRQDSHKEGIFEASWSLGDD
jgi:predicted metal-dependent enzyme (double-stranded beta helix superfamily)